MSVGLCFTSDVFTFDQNWHHQSSPAGGKNLSNDTQIRVIGPVGPEISTEMLRNLSEIFGQNCVPLHVQCTCKCGYSVVKCVCLDDAFLESFELEAIPIECQLLLQKDKKRRKRKGTKVCDLCTCPCKNVVKCGASEKRGMLSCCKCLFE